MYFVFFFKQKTAYEMRISDWSSDVCSSDLSNAAGEYMRRIRRCPSSCSVPRLCGYGGQERANCIGGFASFGELGRKLLEHMDHPGPDGEFDVYARASSPRGERFGIAEKALRSEEVRVGRVCQYV